MDELGVTVQKTLPLTSETTVQFTIMQYLPSALLKLKGKAYYLCNVCVRVCSQLVAT